MKVVAAHFFGFTEEGELDGGKEPLPNVLAGGIFVFLFELAWQENPGIALGLVLSMEEAHCFHLFANFWEGASGQGHGTVFLAFAIVDGEEHRLEIKTVDSQVDAFGQTQATAVEEQNHEAVGGLKLSKDGFNLVSGQHNWDVAMAFGTNDAVDLTEISAQHVPEEEKQRVKRLVLGGGRGAMLDGQEREETANFLVAEFGGGPTAYEGLKACHPKAIGFEGPHGVITHFNGTFQIAEFPFPGRWESNAACDRRRLGCRWCQSGR